MTVTKPTTAANNVRRVLEPLGDGTQLKAADLGAGPWGAAASRTTVGRIRRLSVNRTRIRLDGDVDDQVAQAVAILSVLGAFDVGLPKPNTLVAAAVPAPSGTPVGTGRTLPGAGDAGTSRRGGVSRAAMRHLRSRAHRWFAPSGAGRGLGFGPRGNPRLAG